MKKFRTGHWFLLLFFAGFLTGIFFINYGWRNYSSLTTVFSEEFLAELGTVKISFQKYIWYLLQTRLILCGVLILMMFLRIRKITATVFIYWTGLSVGILFSEAVTQLGMKGSLLCVAGLLPQSLFYIPAVLVFLRYCWNYPQNQWNRQKTVFVSGLFALGILSETYLNPWVIRWVATHLF